MFNHFEEGFMHKRLIAAAFAFTFAMAATSSVLAQSEASALSALSALPVASVVVGASAVTGASIAAPVILSATGAVFVIKAVEVTALSTVYVLERASDGARVSVEVAGRGVKNASFATGEMAAVSLIGAGMILSVAGEVIAFIPNSLGHALLHNERLTY
jgi:ABC-type transport system involved in cytochrome c biogenesis permease subunit